MADADGPIQLTGTGWPAASTPGPQPAAARTTTTGRAGPGSTGRTAAKGTPSAADSVAQRVAAAVAVAAPPAAALPPAVAVPAAVAVPPATAVPAAAAPAGPAPAGGRGPGHPDPDGRDPRRPLLQAAGTGFVLLALVLLGWAGYLYGLSGVQEARTQTTLYERLQYELANEVAPLGPTTPGAPVAILDIPSIGIRDMVVVEGTSPEAMTGGPGHLRDTPLPGQAGVAQVFGRRATFGAPFALLPRLRPGDIIRTITGQGASTYRVSALGSSWTQVRNPAPNQLILLTASSPYVPAYYVYVDADLISTARPGPTAARSLSPSEIALANDAGTLVLALMWALALALVSLAGSMAATRWSPWATYIAVAPVALAVLWNLYQNLSMLLPNLY